MQAIGTLAETIDKLNNCIAALERAVHLENDANDKCGPVASASHPSSKISIKTTANASKSTKPATPTGLGCMQVS